MMFSVFLLPFLLNAGVQAHGFKSETVNFRGVAFRVIALDLKRVDLKLHWKRSDGTPYETLSAVRGEVGPDFIMATNSGIYAKDFTPLGLHVERGRQLRKLNPSRASKGNFFIQPNGVFLVGESGAKILETVEFAKQGLGGVVEATQSGPLLLRRGNINAKFKDGSTNAKLRSGVGVTHDGHVVFAIANGLVSFRDFALLFKEKLNCSDALYLDGTISTFLTAENPSEVQIAPFVGIWAASTKR